MFDLPYLLPECFLPKARRDLNHILSMYEKGKLDLVKIKPELTGSKYELNYFVIL